MAELLVIAFIVCVFAGGMALGQCNSDHNYQNTDLFRAGELKGLKECK